MKLSTISSLAALASGLALTACATARAPVSGFIYTGTHSGVAVSSAQAGSKVGKACASSILGWVGSGDASIDEARRHGGITTVSSVDESSSSILGIYAEYCTIVRGN